jgi:hypothetical protein
MIIAAIIARALFWCFVPVLIMAAITTTIDRQMPAIRAAIRAAREL